MRCTQDGISYQVALVLTFFCETHDARDHSSCPRSRSNYSTGRHRKGQDVASFLEEFVQEAFTVPRQSRTLDEILAPFRAQVEASGMSDTELEAFFEAVREKRFQEQQRHG